MSNIETRPKEEPDFKALYFKLLRAENKAIRIIQEAHQETEEIYMDTDALEEPEESDHPL